MQYVLGYVGKSAGMFKGIELDIRDLSASKVER